MNVTLGDAGDRRTPVPELREPDMTLCGQERAASTPSANSRNQEMSCSQERRLMLGAWTSTMRCLNGLPSVCLTQLFYCISSREMIYYMTWKELSRAGFVAISKRPFGSCPSLC